MTASSSFNGGNDTSISPAEPAVHIASRLCQHVTDTSPYSSRVITSTIMAAEGIEPSHGRHLGIQCASTRLQPSLWALEIRWCGWIMVPAAPFADRGRIATRRRTD